MSSSFDPLKRPRKTYFRLPPVVKSILSSRINLTGRLHKNFGCSEVDNIGTTKAQGATQDSKSSDSDHVVWYARKPKANRRINRLPVELLGLIFLHGTKGDVNFAITVSHVCSRWRYLALRTPSLWTFVDLDGRIRMLTERIRQCRGRPIDVVMRTHRISNRPWIFPDQDDIAICMDIIIPYISLWRSLSLSFSHYSLHVWNAALSRLCPSSPADYINLPYLESLSLIYPANDDAKLFHLFKGNAPRLREVTIEGIRLAWLPNIFSKLTVLHYTHHGLNSGVDTVLEIRTILAVSNQLETLTMVFPASHESVSMGSAELKSRTMSSVELSYLHNLRICTCSLRVPHELPFILYHLHAPRLLRLELSSPRQILSLSTGDIKSVLKPFKHHPTITELRIWEAWFQRTTILSFARTLPVIRHLSIYKGEGYQKIIF